jgi:CheY-like chemotaxis protein
MKILYVEDHADTAAAFSIFLRGWGHFVAVAGTLADARAQISSERFDLLICDLGLPDGSGNELMKDLLKLYPIKAIAVTGYGFPNEIAEARAAGFHMHLLKPIDVAKLRKLIDSLANER